MPTLSLSPSDLRPFAAIAEEKAWAMIEDAVALASRVAPCILDDEFEHAAAAKAVLRGAILRWEAAGTGGVTNSQTVGPFAQATTYARKSMFWPSEIDQLQGLCKAQGSSGAFSVDMVPASGHGHSPNCTWHGDHEACSCGMVLVYAVENGWAG